MAPGDHSPDTGHRGICSGRTLLPLREGVSPAHNPLSGFPGGPDAPERLPHASLLDVDPVVAVPLERHQRGAGAAGDHHPDPAPLLDVMQVLVAAKDGVHLVALEDLE